LACCTALRVFTKIPKPAVNMLKSLSIWLVVCINNMLLMTESKQKLAEHVQLSLFSLGICFLLSITRNPFWVHLRKLSFWGWLWTIPTSWQAECNVSCFSNGPLILPLTSDLCKMEEAWLLSQNSCQYHYTLLFKARENPTCSGIRIRSPWSSSELSLHINDLEYQAATLAVQTFAKEKSSISIFLQLDNSTAVAYINRRGTASPMLSLLTKNLWLWCMKRSILFQAQYLPGTLSTIADKESRTWSGRSEWKLSPVLFQKFNYLLGPLYLDLFASRLSSQFSLLVSWKPAPLAVATDTCTHDWNTLPGKLFANFLCSLIGRVLYLLYTPKVFRSWYW